MAHNRVTFWRSKISMSRCARTGAIISFDLWQGPCPTISMRPGLDLPLKPFFGVMGVAPPAAWGRITSLIPRAMGGNLDNKELVPGAKLYLPVFVPGALFSCGDGHGVQGDGEVC